MVIDCRCVLAFYDLFNLEFIISPSRLIFCWGKRGGRYSKIGLIAESISVIDPGMREKGLILIVIR